jgi:hypothetical protein
MHLSNAIHSGWVWTVSDHLAHQSGKGQWLHTGTDTRSHMSALAIIVRPAANIAISQSVLVNTPFPAWIQVFQGQPGELTSNTLCPIHGLNPLLPWTVTSDMDHPCIHLSLAFCSSIGQVFCLMPDYAVTFPCKRQEPPCKSGQSLWLPTLVISESQPPVSTYLSARC